MKALLHFFLIGGALFLGKTAVHRLAPAERPTIEVVVPVGADDAARATRVDEEILVQEAVRFGWVETDPVIRRRLTRNMAFVNGTGEGSGGAPIEEPAVRKAVSLGMHLTDPVVRGRCVTRMRELLAAPSPGDVPDDGTLRAFLLEHEVRYARPGVIEFAQVLLSKRAHGATLGSAAASLLGRLQAENTEPSRAATMGDVDPLLPALQRGSIAGMDRTFGAGFGDEVSELPAGQWAGPLASPHGLHLVRLLSIERARTPELSAVRERVLADYLDEHRMARIARRMAELRERYTARIVTQPESSG